MKQFLKMASITLTVAVQFSGIANASSPSKQSNEYLGRISQFSRIFADPSVGQAIMSAGLGSSGKIDSISVAASQPDWHRVRFILTTGSCELAVDLYSAKPAPGQTDGTWITVPEPARCH